MAKTDVEEYADARKLLERYRYERAVELGFTETEAAIMAMGNVIDDLVASLDSAGGLLNAMGNSKNLKLSPAQLTVIRERFARAQLSIRRARGEM